MAETFRIEGLRETEQALVGLRENFNLSRATAKNIVKRALVDAAEPVESDATARAPVLTGHLQKSFTTGTTLTRSQKRKHVKGSELEVFVGPGGLPQAIAQEFGTSHNPAQPFLRPAWDGNRHNVMERIKDSLTKEIEKARQRLARKAERLAAKIRAGG